jgi:hypothetical protein
MRRIVFAFLFLVAAACSLANVDYLGIFLEGKKVGYASSQVQEDKKYGADERVDSYNYLSLGLLGQEMKIEISNSTWTFKGKPVRMESKVDSAGRTQMMTAIFGEKTIELELNNSGEKSKKSVPLPADAPVVDDAITAIMNDGAKTGDKKAFYVLDPMTASLVKNEVSILGKKKLEWKGKTYDVNAIEMSEPRAVTTAYFTEKGDVVKIDGPMGMEMVPMTEADAKAEPKDPNANFTDLATTTSIQPDRVIPDPTTLDFLKLKVSGHDLSLLPSDERQTVTKTGQAWTISIRTESADPKTTIAKAAAAKPAWVKPGLNLPADDPSMVKLSRSIVGDEKLVFAASERVRKYVLKIMTPNAGIGVLRDAREVLKSKEGVCRDYAVLTATLLRAAKVPARVASGLVYQDGQFYYHAWAEAWDGGKWFGVDSTRPGSVGVGHIKLAQGSVEDAFTFPFLGKVQMEVLDARRKRTS